MPTLRRIMLSVVIVSTDASSGRQGVSSSPAWMRRADFGRLEVHPFKMPPGARFKVIGFSTKTALPLLGIG